jgi:tRNA pseudouridine13 synthase
MDKKDTLPRSDLPYLTSDLPGVGGVIKQHDEDFVVEELPLYVPSGEGTHAYLTIEKRGLTTHAAIDIIAKTLGRQPHDIGYAGLKDAHGITQQTLSIEHVDPEHLSSLSLGRIRILSVHRHTNKLKLGHLTGNRFVIRIRDTVDSPLEQAKPILDVLSARGVPNYFGPQRFGTRGDNARIGHAVLRDDYEEAIAQMLGRPTPADSGNARKARELFDAGDVEAAAEAWGRSFPAYARVCRALNKAGGNTWRAWRAVDHSLRKLYVSALQSELFNQVLAGRIRGIDRLETGDVAWKHKNGACFLVEDGAAEQARCDAFEVSPTGPLFGRRMKDAKGEPGHREAEVLAASGLKREQIRVKDGKRLDGARRPLRVPITAPETQAGDDDRGPYLQLTFALPRGAYATNVTREICKSSTAPCE